jgi:aminoglycoside phosphotransferase family enzyme/predicted kinase
VPESAIPEHIRWLLNEDGEAELKQTHVSFVVLREHDVLKLKKPVRFDFIDLRSLEARRAACENEVLLNSRLCPDLYLGVVPVTRTAGGVELGGSGEVIDYAVHMKRLSDEGMLDRMLEENRAGISTVGQIAGRLARFHERAITNEEVTATGGYRRLLANWEDNFAAVASVDPDVLPPASLRAIRDFVTEQTKRLEARLLAREREGRIRDGHGDLRADAIWVNPENSEDICIFDCLEFDVRYRYSDTGLDTAFLAMDLDARGHQLLSDLFVGLYCQASGDDDLPLLLSFFKCYRAFVRGKVRHLASQDAAIPLAERNRARNEAGHQFRLALGYCSRPRVPSRLIVVCGLTGSGKSVLAGTLAARLGAAFVSTDVTRKRLAGLAPTSSAATGYRADLYSREATGETYRKVLNRAGEFLQAGVPVVVDGTFSLRSQRAAAAELVKELQVPLLFLECRAPEEVIRDRQQRRATDSWRASDATWDVYRKQRSEAEPIEENEGRHAIIDTTTAFDAQIGRAVDVLG